MGECELLRLPALGRPFDLGELYDARTDQIGQGYLETGISEDYTKLEMTQTSYERFKGNAISAMDSQWEMNADLRVGMLTQAFNVGGAVDYLNRKSSHRRTAYATLRYHRQSETRQLKKDFSEYVHGHSASTRHATHFVCKIMYGAEAFFVFEKKTQSRQKEKGWKVNVGADVESLPMGMSVGTGKAKNRAAASDNFHCFFYGDFELDELPTSLEDAEELCKDIPRKLVIVYSF